MVKSAPNPTDDIHRHIIPLMKLELRIKRVATVLGEVYADGWLDAMRQLKGDDGAVSAVVGKKVAHMDKLAREKYDKLEGHARVAADDEIIRAKAEKVMDAGVANFRRGLHKHLTQALDKGGDAAAEEYLQQQERFADQLQKDPIAFARAVQNTVKIWKAKIIEDEAGPKVVTRENPPPVPFIVGGEHVEENSAPKPLPAGAEKIRVR